MARRKPLTYAYSPVSDVETELHQVPLRKGVSGVRSLVVTRAALYLRISQDHTGEGLAVARQREDALRLAKDRGWKVATEYVDNSISASDSRKVRPGYDALCRDFEAGSGTR